MIGHNSLFCVTVIPLLSLAPFAAVLYALRSGAPANPTVAGAVGGLLSAGIAATLYASHCTDDSPLFRRGLVYDRLRFDDRTRSLDRLAGLALVASL